MKKALLFLIALSICISTANSMEFKYYIKGGIIQSHLDFEKDIYDDCKISVAQGGKVIGAQLGLMGEFSFPLFPLSFEPEILFTFTGGALDVENRSEEKMHNITERLGRIDIPFRFVYTIGPINLKAGLVANLPLFANEEFKDIVEKKFEGYKVNDILEDVSLSYQLALGVTLGEDFKFSLRYESFFESKGISFENNVFDTDFKTTQLVFSLGYRM